MPAAIPVIVTSTASHRASRERDLECKLLISEFNQNDSPKVIEMQECAQCVNRIYPSASHPYPLKGALQVFIVGSIILALTGVAWEKFFGKGNDYAYVASLWFVGGWIIIALASLAIYAFS